MITTFRVDITPNYAGNRFRWEMWSTVGTVNTPVAVGEAASHNAAVVAAEAAANALWDHSQMTTETVEVGEADVIEDGVIVEEPIEG